MLIGQPFNPNWLLSMYGFYLIVGHIVCLVLEGIVGYVEKRRQTRCRHADERWKGNDGNLL